MRKVLARLGRGGAAADIRVAQQHGGAAGKGLERDEHASIEEEDEALDDGRSHFAILKICLIESAVIYSVHRNFSMSFLACSSTILIY